MRGRRSPKIIEAAAGLLRVSTTFVEPRRAASGKAVIEGVMVVILYDDGRVEYWTPIGSRMVVEHWFPAAQFPAAARAGHRRACGIRRLRLIPSYFRAGVRPAGFQ